MAESQSPTVTKAAVFALLVIVFLAVVGNYHFVYGAGRDFTKIPKVSWSLSETLINLDEVGGMPLLAVRVKYPLFLQAAEAMKADMMRDIEEGRRLADSPR